MPYSESALRKTGDEPGFLVEELKIAFSFAQEQPDHVFTIIPVRLEDCSRGDHRLTGFQQFDLFKDWDKELDRLAVQIGGSSLSDEKITDKRSKYKKLIEELRAKSQAFYYAGDDEQANKTLKRIRELELSRINKNILLLILVSLIVFLSLATDARQRDKKASLDEIERLEADLKKARDRDDNSLADSLLRLLLDESRNLPPIDITSEPESIELDSIETDRKWIPWPDKEQEFSPVIGLHRQEPFYPTTIEAFIAEDCDLMVWLGLNHSSKNAVIGREKLFTDVPFPEKIKLLINPEHNNKRNYLDLHGSKVDMRASVLLQKDRYVYARGFRNVITNEAYITYWFFFVEQFIPRFTDETKIDQVLYFRPDDWWSHEGDWEKISIYFANYVEPPTSVFFSQHKKPVEKAWERVKKREGRVLVLPALGTHATYNEPVTKKLNILSLDPFNDYYDIVNPHNFYYPASIAGPDKNSYHLETLDPRLKHLWLHYKGRWGDSGSIMDTAPRGPLFQRIKHFELLADEPLR